MDNMAIKIHENGFREIPIEEIKLTGEDTNNINNLDITEKKEP